MRIFAHCLTQRAAISSLYKLEEITMMGGITMLKKRKTLAVGISGLFAVGVFAVLIYSGPAQSAPPSPPLGGSYVVQASGTAYFYTNTNGQTEVLHFTMAGSASFDKRTG